MLLGGFLHRKTLSYFFHSAIDDSLVDVVVVLHAPANYGQFLFRIEVRRRFLAEDRGLEHGDNRYRRK